MRTIRLEDEPKIHEMIGFMKQRSEKGIKVNSKDKLSEYVDIMEKELSNIEDDISRKYGINNVRSPKQIADFIESDRCSSGLDNNDVINICRDKITGKISTCEDNLEELVGLGYEFAGDILKYREYKKIYDCVKSIYEFSDSNNRIHPVVELGSTNRLQWSKPAVMSIPKDIHWKIIVKPEDDCVCYSADIKNQEPGIIALETNSEIIKKALKSNKGLYNYFFEKCFEPKAYCYIMKKYNEVGVIDNDAIMNDPDMISIGIMNHVGNNSTFILGEKIEFVYNNFYYGATKSIEDRVVVVSEAGEEYSVQVEWDPTPIRNDDTMMVLEGAIKGMEIRIDEKDRNEFKRNWLAFTYGRNLKNTKGKYIDLKKLDAFIENVGLADYKKKMQNLARTKDSVKTLFGTQISILGPGGTYSKKTRAMNYPIQGTGADVLSILIYKINEELKNDGLENDISIYFTRHDEIIFNVKKNFEDSRGIEWVTSKIRELGEHKINDIEFKVEVNRYE